MLIVDMLNDFVREGAVLEVPAAREIIPCIKQKINEARESNYPIIYLCDQHDENDEEFKLYPPHAIAGSWGGEVIEELKPKEGDYVIPKTRFSGFYKTELEDLLEELKVNHLIITGTVTNICVLYTVADAVMRGYRVTVPVNCVAGLNKEDHNFALRQMREVLKVELI